jgi:hypothetical protein
MGFAPVTVNFPDSGQAFKEPAEKAYLDSMVQVSRTELNARTRDDVARSTVLMQSTDNSVWALTVAPDGTVRTTKVR